MDCLPAHSLPRLDFDSDQMPACSALAFWSSAIPEFEITQPAGSHLSDFQLHATAWLLGEMVVTHGRVTAATFTRSEARARVDGADNGNLVLLTAGMSVCEFEGRLVRLRPGHVVSLDYARPSIWRAADSEFINVSIARTALILAQPHLPDFHGRLLESASGRLLGDYLVALEKQLPRLRVEDSSDIARATINLVKAAFAGLPAQREVGGAPLRQRIRRLINQHLTDRDLTAARLAEELGISRSALYASCEPLGGISNYIRQRRLEAVRARLSLPEENRNIAELAETYGFKTPSHFSQAFRRAYGETPGAVRRLGTEGRPAVAFREGQDKVRVLRGWMRGLAAR